MNLMSSDFFMWLIFALSMAYNENKLIVIEFKSYFVSNILI